MIDLPRSVPLSGARSSAVVAITRATSPLTSPLVPGVQAVGVPGIGNLSGEIACM